MCPPNTTATIHVPANQLDDVTENGGKITDSPGVTLLRFEKDRAVLKVGSGNYKFASQCNHQQ